MGAILKEWFGCRLAVNPYPFTYIGFLWGELKKKLVG